VRQDIRFDVPGKRTHIAGRLTAQTDKRLGKGIVRPFPGDPDEIVLQKPG